MSDSGKDKQVHREATLLKRGREREGFLENKPFDIISIHPYSHRVAILFCIQLICTVFSLKERNIGVFLNFHIRVILL